MHDSSVSTQRPSTVERWAPSVYFVIGQLGWFGCVLSAAHDVPWMGVAATIVLKKGVFIVITEKDVLQGVRIFNSRFINKIKHPSTNKAFKKSRLVI